IKELSRNEIIQGAYALIFTYIFAYVNNTHCNVNKLSITVTRMIMYLFLAQFAYIINAPLCVYSNIQVLHLASFLICKQTALSALQHTLQQNLTSLVVKN